MVSWKTSNAISPSVVISSGCSPVNCTGAGAAVVVVLLTALAVLGLENTGI